MKKPNLPRSSVMLLLTLALSSCGFLSKRPAPYQPPQIPPLPAEIVQEKHEPSLTQRLEKLFSQ